jgi:hypothetical protein
LNNGDWGFPEEIELTTLSLKEDWLFPYGFATFLSEVWIRSSQDNSVGEVPLLLELIRC